MTCVDRRPLVVFAALLALAVAELPSPLFDNAIDGKPEVVCSHDSIKFFVGTSKKAPAQIYVKGNSDNPDCIFHDATNATIPLNKCNMRRKREIKPSGMAYTFTVVVQLHPMFVTKVDRAYNVHCFYMEAQKELKVELGVSDPTTQTISETPELPTCSYSVHRDSANGPLAKVARVGDVLYHVWDCPSDMYAILLHSCEATDGKGGRQMVVDEHGCPVDEYLMPQITYNDQVTRGLVASYAFNFPDQSSMIFNCQIKLCFKQEDCSSITPPKCGVKKQLDAGSQNSLTDELAKEELIPSDASTTPAPSTTTTASTSTTPKAVEMPRDFPRPNVLPSDDEGSGQMAEEEEERSTGPTAAPAFQLLKKAKAKAASRSQRHSPISPRSLVNFDVQSPELTIMDDYLDAAQQPAVPAKQFFSPDRASLDGDMGLPNRVCVPATAIYSVGGLVVLFTVVVLVLLCKSRNTLVHKFY